MGFYFTLKGARANVCECVRYNESPVASFASASEFPSGIEAHLRIQEDPLLARFCCFRIFIVRASIWRADGDMEKFP